VWGGGGGVKGGTHTSKRGWGERQYSRPDTRAGVPTVNPFLHAGPSGAASTMHSHTATLFTPPTLVPP
jgi:hypothetical protein